MPRQDLNVARERLEEFNRNILAFADANNMPKEYFSLHPLELHPVVVSASRKLTILARSMSMFLEDLTTCGYHSASARSYYARHHWILKCPIIWSKDKQSVIVFPNIPLDHASYHRINGVKNNMENPWFPDVTASLCATILDELEHPDKCKAWQPMSRGIKRLGKRLEMPISRAIARYVDVGRNPLDAQDIDNISQKMLELNMPTSFHIADDVDDMRLMYVRESGDTPSSCMDSKHSFGLSKNVRPIDFYAHCPVTRGAYIARGTTVLARTILWQLSDNEWYYGRIYQTRSVHAEELETKLREANIKPLSRVSLHVADIEFNIPADHYNDDAGCPMPYFDAQPFNHLAVVYESVDDVFKCCLLNREPQRKHGYEFPSLSMTSGVHIHSPSVHCTSCEDELDPSECYQVESDLFCGMECVLNSDVHVLLTTTSEELIYNSQYQPDSDHIAGVLSTYSFSNEECARRRGMLYHAVSWADMEIPHYYWQPAHNCHGDILASRCGEGGYTYDSKSTRRATIFAQYHPTRCRIDANGWFMFLETVAEHRVLPISKMAKIPSVGYIGDYPDVNIEDLFEQALDGALNQPAPLLEGAQYSAFHA